MIGRLALQKCIVVKVMLYLHYDWNASNSITLVCLLCETLENCSQDHVEVPLQKCFIFERHETLHSHHTHDLLTSFCGSGLELRSDFVRSCITYIHTLWLPCWSLSFYHFFPWIYWCHSLYAAGQLGSNINSLSLSLISAVIEFSAGLSIILLLQ